MEDFFSPLTGISPMLFIVCIEALIVIVAMAVDFVSGFRKAKLRGEVRCSEGLRRTVLKFVLYLGSLLIAFGIDAIFFMCDFWLILHLSALNGVPIFSSLVAVFICAVEIRSVWENAEEKQQRNARKTAEMLGAFLDRERLKEFLTEQVASLKDK
jgi:hypothetical protein